MEEEGPEDDIGRRRSKAVGVEDDIGRRRSEGVQDVSGRDERDLADSGKSGARKRVK